MKKVIQIFFQLPRAKQIATVVCIAHFSALFFLLCHHLLSFPKRSSKSMVIRTIAIPAEKKENIIAANPAAKSTPAPQKKLPPPKKTTTLPKKTDQKPLTQEITKSFDALSSESKTFTPLTVPTKKEIKSQSKTQTKEPYYEELLIAYLQNILDLPEYGEVKLEIEINGSGTLVSCKINESKSIKNAKFLTEKLTLLTFPVPPLATADQTKKFSITFKNQ